MENFFEARDYIHINDEDLNVNRYSRILAFERDMLNPYLYDLEIGDALEKNRVIELVKDVRRIDIKVK